MKLFFLIILIFFVIATSAEIELKKGDVGLRIIAHSHCDSGWTSTMQQYYSNQVKSIITTMVQALEVETNPPRKFVWSEIGFLEQWWNDIPEYLKQAFIKHVKNDRIEFVNGGWVMNDEACPSAESVIRQLSNGHKFIRDKFGKQPESAWQIDPFGHSSFTPTIQAQMGYKHIVLNRIHYELKDKFKREKNLQFKWRGSPEGLGPKSDILAHVFDDFYTGPPHFNFDGYNFQAYGLDRLVDELISLANNRSIFYKSPFVLIPIGGDFAYKNAIKAMDSMDQIFKKVNERYERGESNVHVQYTTLSEFFSDTIKWHNQNNVEFNYYDGDFLPYADDSNNYWTGYYTTRPLLKGYERYVSSKLRSAEIYSTFQNSPDFSSSPLIDASKQVSILQHHDAITGTSKKHVVQDYFLRLFEADKLISESSSKSLAYAMSPSSPTKLNVIDIGGSISFPSSSDVTSFTIINQLSWKKEELMTIKIQSDQYINYGGDRCPYVLSVDSIDNEIEIDCSPRSDFKNDQSDDHTEFIQIDFPSLIKPFSNRIYYLKRLSTAKNQKSNWVLPVTSHVNYIENSLFKTYLDNQTYLIKYIESKEKGSNEITQLNQQLLSYSDNGGAYVFRTNTKVYQPPRSLYSTFTYIGKFYQEAQSILQDEFQQVQRFGYYYGSQKASYKTYSYNSIRLLNTGNEMIDKKIKFNFHIKGINGTTTINKFSTNIINNREIYTDNGLEMMHRKSKSVETAPIGKETQSYYPTVNIVYIESSSKQLVCNNDRARGVASLCQGCLEIALHRSLHLEDGKGLEDPAIDESSINAKLECYLTIRNDKELDDIRKQSINYQHKFQIYQVEDSSKMKSMSFISPYKSLPDGIHIQTLERSGLNSIKLRIQNIKSIGSGLISFDLNGLFSFISSIQSIKEYNLSLVNPYADNNIDNIVTKSFNSIVDNNLFPIKNSPPRYTPINQQSPTTISLLPSEIKAIEIFYK